MVNGKWKGHDKACPFRINTSAIYSVFAGFDYCRCSGGRWVQTLANKLIDVRLDQLTVDDPGFFREYLAFLRQLCRLKKNIPGRAPFSRVSRGLAITIVRSLFTIISRFRLAYHSVGRTVRPKECTD